MNAQEIACNFPCSRAQENHSLVHWLGFLLLLLLEMEIRGWKWRIKHGSQPWGTPAMPCGALQRAVEDRQRKEVSCP